MLSEALLTDILLFRAEGGGFEPLLRRIKNQSIIFLTMR